jgi:hypothetical protein
MARPGRFVEGGEGRRGAAPPNHPARWLGHLDRRSLAPGGDGRFLVAGLMDRDEGSCYVLYAAGRAVGA